jgi:hypothetical protein
MKRLRRLDRPPNATVPYSVVGHVGIVVGVRYSRDGKAIHVRTVEGNVSDKATDLGRREITELTSNGLPAT